MATIVISIIPSGGGDYTTLSAAESGARSTYSNLVADGNSIIFRLNESASVGGAVTFGAWTTDSTHTITIDVPMAYRHNSTRGSGARIVLTGGYQTGITTSCGNVFINGLAIDAAGGAGSCAFYNVYDNVVLNGCLFYNSAQHTYYHNGQSLSHTLTLINCMAYGGAASGCFSTNGGEIYAYNCTFINNSTGMRSDGYNWIWAKNCYCGNNSAADYSINAEGHVVITNSFSSDGSLSTTIATIANCHFTNSGAGTENIHIDLTSSLHAAGTDLSADAHYGVATDFEGTARPTTPSIGADEPTQTAVDASTVTENTVLAFNPPAKITISMVDASTVTENTVLAFNSPAQITISMVDASTVTENENITTRSYINIHDSVATSDIASATETTIYPIFPSSSELSFTDENIFIESSLTHGRLVCLNFERNMLDDSGNGRNAHTLTAIDYVPGYNGGHGIRRTQPEIGAPNSNVDLPGYGNFFSAYKSTLSFAFQTTESRLDAVTLEWGHNLLRGICFHVSSAGIRIPMHRPINQLNYDILGAIDSQWHILIATFNFASDGSGGDINVYMDGALFGTVSPDYFILQDGDHFGFFNGDWHGCLDQIQYWNRVLTSDEIASLWTLNPKKGPLPVVTIPLTQPVAYFPCDEGTGNVLTDYQGSFSITGSDLKWGPGHAGHVSSWDSVTPIESLTVDFGLGAAYSVAFWAYNYSGANGVLFYFDNGHYIGSTSEAGKGVEYTIRATHLSGHVSEFDWMHIGYVIDGYRSKFYIYINGELNLTGSLTEDMTDAILTKLGTYSGDTFPARINDLVVWDRAVSRKDIIYAGYGLPADLGLYDDVGTFDVPVIKIQIDSSPSTISISVFEGCILSDDFSSTRIHFDKLNYSIVESSSITENVSLKSNSIIQIYDSTVTSEYLRVLFNSFNIIDSTSVSEYVSISGLSESRAPSVKSFLAPDGSLGQINPGYFNPLAHRF